MTADDLPLKRMMDRRLGCCAWSEAVSIGYTDRMLRRRVADGRLLLLLPGVLGIPSAAASPDRNLVAAWLYAGPHSVISHASAARIWKLSVPAMQGDASEVGVTVTIPASRREMSCPGVTVRRSRFLPPQDCVRIGMVRSTSVARTIGDLARSARKEEVRRLVDEAILAGLITPERFTAWVAATPPRPGIGRLRSALAAWTGDGRPESHAEIQVARWLSRLGIPSPVRQHEVGRSRRVRLDFAWPEHRLALEVDGFRYHDGPDRFRADRARSNWLAAQGWTVLRTTLSEVEAGGADLAHALRRHLSSTPATHAPS